MTVYFVTVFFVFIFSYIANTQKVRTPNLAVNSKESAGYILFVSLCAVILICVSGLRYQVGTDYMSYMQGYGTRVANVWDDIASFNEPALGVIALISAVIYDDFATMFFNVALFTVVLNVRTISKYSSNFFVGIMLYIFIGAWHNSFNGIRQYMAAAVIFAGHRFILEKKFWKYCLVVLLASCCHITALVMLPLYFVVNRKVNLKNIILVVGIAVIMRYSYDFFFSIMNTVKGRDQTEFTYMQTEVNIFRILVAFAPLVLPIFARKGFLEDRENRLYFNMLLMNAAFMFATAESAYLARVGIYTEIFATLAFPKLLDGMSSDNKKFMTTVIMVLYFGFWVYELLGRDALNNYQWIFAR